MALTSGQASGSRVSITRSLLEIDFLLSCWVPQLWEVAQEADFFFSLPTTISDLNMVDSRIGEKDKKSLAGFGKYLCYFQIVTEPRREASNKQKR